MDVQQLVEVLQGTIHPDTREMAEKQLNEIHKIIEFTPKLMRVIMEEDKPFPGQAGVIYLKNMVMQFWQQREPDSPQEPIPFHIHEQDKVAIRQIIIEAIISSPELIRVQLAVCLSVILKYDFPGRWDQVVDQMLHYISMENPQVWYGAFIAIYQLVKNYEYKKPEERGPLHAAMSSLLPMLYARCVQLLPDASEASVLLQKMVLKIFYALIQCNLPLELVTKEVFTQWMQVLQTIVDRPVPEATLQINLDERPELAWWKCKKWALHILARVFERYGSPGNVTKEYVKFSDWYIKAFTVNTVNILFKVLDQFRQKQYVAPRVLQQSLNYLNTGVSHAAAWKIMKPHMQVDSSPRDLIPLMCYTDEDDELWNEDPYEYIRIKFDVFEDFISPVMAAQTILHSCASKRKEVLQKTMGFCMQVLTEPNANPRQKDGALHVIGSLADILLKKKIYKEQMENMLVNHVFPEFHSQLGYMRARANWVVHSFNEVKYKNKQNLEMALQLTRTGLIEDKEMPVKVEAAFAIQMLITSHDKAKEIVQPQIKEIIQALLHVIRETEKDDLTGVMQKLIYTYGEDIIPIAVEITQHLATTFTQVLDADIEQSDDKAITAMGILNTIETILNVVEEKKEIVLQLEGIVLDVVGVVLQNSVIDFYEEVLALIFSMTCTHISPPLWQVFQMMYETFQDDMYDYFVDMMPALHNFVTTDPNAFISNPKHLEIIYTMCKKVLAEDAGEDPECHAAKLLEVILLQFKGRIDQVVPLFIEVALNRLTREVKSTELRQMCLQVVVAALYYNPMLLLATLEKMTIPNTNEAVTAQFIKQWLHDTDCFLGLHDRKICVLGLCALMSLPQRPPIVDECAQQFMPSLLILFRGLKRAYECRALAEEDSSGEEEDDSDFDGEVLESDEDEIDDEGADYLERLEKAAACRKDEEEDDAYEETALEGYNTPLDEEDCSDDEYVIFKLVMQEIQANNPVWYNALTSHLTEDQQKELQEVVVLADQRTAAKESKRIEEQGGYQFQNPTVPTTFNFGASL
ncbi:LOW QUALITY PROTEIN: importin-7-like [Amphiura filiformis]|uniref:LOW QUALITY PROTEIN: importin-7-like n=1 Tax=Amphiura filiformis TaxID=82378 RepID=UPI003B21A28A